MSEHIDNRAVAIKVGVVATTNGMGAMLAKVGIASWSDVSFFLASIVSVIVAIDYIWIWFRRRRPRGEKPDKSEERT